MLCHLVQVHVEYEIVILWRATPDQCKECPCLHSLVSLNYVEPGSCNS